MVQIPTTGKGDWVDYNDYWREADAEWLMKRTVLRYNNFSARDADLSSPEVGMLTYNASQTTNGGGLDYYTTSGSSAWIPVLAAANLRATPIVATATDQAVSIGHKGNSGVGISFNVDGVLDGRVAVQRPFQTTGNVLYADSTGVSLKTGTKTAKLTTSTTSLVSDSPISAPGASITGTTTLATANVTTLDVSGTATVDGVLTANAQVVISDTTPTSDSHATRKDYCDDKLRKTGGIMSGQLSINQDPDLGQGISLETFGRIHTHCNTAGTPNLTVERTVSVAVVAGQPYIRFIRAGSVVGSVEIKTGGGGVDFNESSDYRLKNDLGPITDGIERVRQLQPKRITWKADPDAIEQDAFIAHEVQTVVPEAVTGPKDGAEMQQFDSKNLIPVLTAATKDLIGQVAALTARIDTLEGATS